MVKFEEELKNHSFFGLVCIFSHKKSQVWLVDVQNVRLIFLLEFKTTNFFATFVPYPDAALGTYFVYLWQSLNLPFFLPLGCIFEDKETQVSWFDGKNFKLGSHLVFCPPIILTTCQFSLVPVLGLTLATPGKSALGPIGLQFYQQKPRYVLSTRDTFSANSSADVTAMNFFGIGLIGDFVGQIGCSEPRWFLQSVRQELQRLRPFWGHNGAAASEGPRL